MRTLDSIIPKLLREYVDTGDPARRAELVQILQESGALPKIFEFCAKELSENPRAIEAIDKAR